MGEQSPEIDTGSFDVTPPSGGGASAPPSGGSTNMFTNASVPSYDQWLYAPLTIGYSSAVRDTQHGSGGKGLEEVTSHISSNTRVKVERTPFALLQAFNSMSVPEYKKFKKKLVAAGFVSAEADPVSVRDAWLGLLKDVQQFQGQGAGMTPFQYLNTLIRKNGFDPKKIGTKDLSKDAATGFQPSTTKTTSVYDMDGAQAEQLLTQTLQQALGRDPSKAEIEDFVDAVKSRALADPSTQVTQTRRGDRSGLADANTQVQVQTIGGKSYSTIQTVNDGFGQDDAALLAEKRAKAAPDYASSQAVGTYFPALLQALGSTV